MGVRVWLDLPQVDHTSFTLSRTKEFFKSPGSGGSFSLPHVHRDGGGGVVLGDLTL